MKTKDDFLKGAKITDDAHQLGPANDGGASHHSPQTARNGVKGSKKK
ncbi:hypothetical protein [Bacillus sp. FJAT-27225]|nr:hypothetical protein [Bacillus sp. FJAT-27225]